MHDTMKTGSLAAPGHAGATAAASAGKQGAGRIKRRPIKESERQAWASMAQMYVLDALMSVQPWGGRQLAFHGGTSLHFSWQSPRFSEDLDFLLAKELHGDLERVMRRVELRVAEQLLRVDPGLRVEIRKKTSDMARMGNFHIVVTHEQVLERVMVKAEFWSVDEEYLRRYPTEFRSPVLPGDVVARTNVLVPAAQLSTALADKLVALAGRPYLKWRDIHDVWHITTQTRGVNPEPGRLVPSEVIEQFLHNRLAYDVDPGPEGVAHAITRLRQFAALPTADLAHQAVKDLRPFLPKAYWERLAGDGLVQMVEHTKAVVLDAAEQLQAMLDRQAIKEPKALESAPAATQAGEGIPADDEADDGEQTSDQAFDRPRHGG